MAATLYAKSGCPYCATAEGILRAEGIAFDTVDVAAPEKLAELATLAGQPASALTVPKVLLGSTLVRSGEELKDLRATSALRHLARAALAPPGPRQSLEPWLAAPARKRLRPERAVAVLHTGPTSVVWIAELERSLVVRGAAVHFLDMEQLGPLDLRASLRFSVLVNRVSDAVPPSLARFVTSFLSFAELQGVPTINGSAPYAAATSKLVQHAIFHAAGLRTPESAVVRCAADVEAAAARLLEGGGALLFKPNAGSFGAGIVKFDDQAALLQHAQRPGAFGNDGVAILQAYHAAPHVKRVFVMGGEVLLGVSTQIEQGNLGGGMCMASAAKRKTATGASAVEVFPPDDGVRRGCIEAMRLAGADVGSIEYLLEPATQEPLFFDLNLLSTFPPNEVAGRHCWDEFAEFILGKIRSQEGSEPAASLEVELAPPPV